MGIVEMGVEKMIKTAPWRVIYPNADKKRVLVTGAAGFVGSHVVDLLIEKGYHVVGIDNLSSGKIDNVHPHCEFFEADIRLLRGINLADNFDAIVHLAAQPSLLNSEKWPIKDADVNILGTIMLLEYAKNIGCKKFVFSSTSAVHSVTPSWGTIMCDENSTPSPNRPYGISKLTAETYITHLCGNMDYVLLRFANVYGPRQVPLGENQLIPRALDHIYNNEPFKIYGTGTNTRDFTYVGDVAKAVLKAVELDRMPYNPVLNISTGVSSSVEDVLGSLKDISDWDGEFDHGSAVLDEPARIIMPNLRAKNILHWRPRTKLLAGLKKTVEWWKHG